MSFRNVYNVPSNFSFIDELSKQILIETEKDPLLLTKYTIFLPTRRSCKYLQDSFIKNSKKNAMFLPKLISLGDIDLNDLEDCDLDLPKTVHPLIRCGLITKLILANEKNKKFEKVNISTIYQLSASLLDLIDEINVEGVSFSSIDRLVPKELSDHWQVVFRFLKIVDKYWPKILEERGFIEKKYKQKLIIDNIIKNWSIIPPKGYILIAGSTGSIKSTSILSKMISSLPNGRVVLQGLNFDEENSQDINFTHPQYYLKKLLNFIGISIKDVQLWPSCCSFSLKENNDRLQLVSQMMNSVKVNLDKNNLCNAVKGNIKKINCTNLQEEAEIISLIIRKSLNDEKKTIMLVSPDKVLIRQVLQITKKWNINISNSIGVPLQSTLIGSFLILICEFAVNSYSINNFITLLKHPFTLFGFSREKYDEIINRLELKFLRGVFHNFSLEELIKKVEEKDLLNFCRRFHELFYQFKKLLSTNDINFKDLLKSHLTLAESIAESNLNKGNINLWNKEEGISEFFSELLIASSDFPNINSGNDYLELISVLMRRHQIHDNSKIHSRLLILDPIEARLLHADIVILSSLNEGIWPKNIKQNLWLNKRMREKLGLPNLDCKIGLSAHDFTQLLSAEKVFLTRSTRVSGVPTVPSRWLLFLKSVLKKYNLYNLINVDEKYWKNLNQAQNVVSIKHLKQAPAPCPLAIHRPRELSVTDITIWNLDPYSMYANKILKLRPLEKINKKFDNSEWGIFLHKVLNIFIKEGEEIFNNNTLKNFLEIGREKLGNGVNVPTISNFWWPRFELIARSFLEEEMSRNHEIQKSYTEINGQLRLFANTFTLKARADRIDLMKDGSVVIIDYKSGLLPSMSKIKSGYYPQLPLEAFIAMNGGFSNVPKSSVSKLYFWSLKDHNVKMCSIDEDPAVLANKYFVILKHLIEKFNNDETPYFSRPRFEKQLPFNDYSHLARIKEWANLE